MGAKSIERILYKIWYTLNIGRRYIALVADTA